MFALQTPPFIAWESSLTTGEIYKRTQSRNFCWHCRRSGTLLFSLFFWRMVVLLVAFAVAGEARRYCWRVVPRVVLRCVVFARTKAAAQRTRTTKRRGRLLRPAFLQRRKDRRRRRSGSSRSRTSKVSFLRAEHVRNCHFVAYLSQASKKKSLQEEKDVVKRRQKIMEKSASFPAYSVGTTLSAQCYLGIEPLLQRAASTGDAELLLTLLKVL